MSNTNKINQVEIQMKFDKAAFLKNLPDVVTKSPKKEKVLHFFQEDLTKYLSELDKLSAKASQFPAFNKEIHKKFSQLTNEIIEEGENIAESINDKLAVKKIKQNFRIAIKNYIREGVISRRAYDRPRGYPGDYGIIEMFYDNQEKGEGLCVYWDRFLLDQDYVQAVRDRKDYMKKALQEYIPKSSLKTINIFNLGSGSCREWRELPEKYLSSKEISVTFLDQDQESLDFSKGELQRIHPKVNFKFLKDSVTNLAKNLTSYKKTFGQQDLIYSIGLADYIPDEFINQMLTSAMELLKPSGSFILAHKNVPRHKSPISDWMSNWNFIPRTKDKVLEMIKEQLKPYKYKLVLEDIGLGHVFYIRVDKE